MDSAIALGKRIYDVRKGREARRCVIFILRCWLNRGRMRKLDDYFHTTPLHPILSSTSSLPGPSSIIDPLSTSASGWWKNT